MVFLSKETVGKKLLLSPLALFSFFFKQLGNIRYYGYSHGLFPSRKLPLSVVSVGNISVGGTGKTPMTIYLSAFFRKHGKRVAILSRGYKGSSYHAVNIVSDGRKICLSPAEAGDEPFLVAEKLPGVPVLTGKDRGLLGEYARAHFSTEVAVLDDGFQHLKLQRDLDIVLLDGRNPLGNSYVLPRGMLRESPKQLKRAQLIVVTHPDETIGKEEIEDLIRSYNQSAPVFWARYRPVALEELKTRETVSLDSLKGEKVVAVAGLGRPESFARLLAEIGAEVEETRWYPDHYRYRGNELGGIADSSIIVTTEKDAVKLRNLSIPQRTILVLSVELKVDDEINFQETIRNCLPS